MRIALDDPRLEFRRDGNVAYFTIGEHRPGLVAEMGVRIEGEELVFFPQRSAAQRALLKTLGESV